MGMLGDARMVIWYDVTPGAVSEHDDWHSHEHMPERLGIPGFLRGRRSVTLSGSRKYFIMYEVENFATLKSEPYLERVNNPTPWTTKMMSHVRNTTRSLCRVRASFGSGMGQILSTIRFAPVAGKEDVLRGWLTENLLPGLSARPGMVGVHLLEAKKQAGQPQTKEQKLRGGDAEVDWVLIVEGYDSDTVISVLEKEFRGEAFARHGASPEQVTEVYRLAFALTDRDDRDTAAGA